jgi:hypothetical protein
MRSIVVLCMVLVARVAAAGNDAPDITKLITADGDPSGAEIALVGNNVYTNAAAKDMAADMPKDHVMKNVAGAYSKNKKSYWATAELTASATPKVVDGHASALWDKTDKGWKLIAFAIVPTATGKQQAAANKAKLVPPKVTQAENANDYFLTVFGAFLGSPGDGISDRKDAVLFGSAPTERYVGGAKIKKTITGWNLMLDQRDGRADNITKGGKLLYIVGNFDARPQGKDKATPTPYRVFFIFEGPGGGVYDLVHANFAAMVEKPWAP